MVKNYKPLVLYSIKDKLSSRGEMKMKEPQREIERMNTSVKIDPDLWKDAKIEAIRNDITVSELLEEAIDEWIKRRVKK